MENSFEIQCHFGRYRKHGSKKVRDALIYYVNDVAVGTTVSEVRYYIGSETDLKPPTMKMVRDVCMDAKDYSKWYSYTLRNVDGVWEYFRVD